MTGGGHGCGEILFWSIIGLILYFLIDGIARLVW